MWDKEENICFDVEGYLVLAYSYDGELDLTELFNDYETAKKVFDYVQEHYIDTPPTEELDEFMERIRKA